MSEGIVDKARMGLHTMPRLKESVVFLYCFFIWFLWIYRYIVDKFYISIMPFMPLFQEDSLKYLEESYRSEDFLWFNQYVKLYKTKLNKIKTSWIVGFVWPFGCGKTTFVNQLKEDWEWWINFEAWKYPERKDLWENFILETATQIWEKDFKQIEKIVDGKQHNGIRTLFKLLNLIPIVKDLWWEAVSKGIDHFFAPVPLTRVYQFQNLLANIFLEKIKDHDVIFIIIEDIDRSGDHGVYFLETLNFFLKNLELPEGKRIIAIATIGNKEFVNNKESYLKCLDYMHYFPIQEFKSEEMVNRFLSLIPNKINYKNLCDFFNYIWKNFQWYFTPRVFKHIFREVFIISQELGIEKEVDLCVLFWFVTSKYIFTKQNDIDISYFDKRIMDIWPNLDSRIKWRSFLQSFFMATLHGQPFLVEDEQWNLVPKLMVFQNVEGLRFSFKDLEWCIIYKEENKEKKNNNIINIRLDKRLLSI